MHYTGPMAKIYIKQKHKPTQCRYCNTSFTPARPWQGFCSTKCRNHWHLDRRIVRDAQTGNIPTNP